VRTSLQRQSKAEVTAATDRVSGQWRCKPQRIDGAPIGRAAIVQVTFKK
jgi:hypothetical protein